MSDDRLTPRLPAPPWEGDRPGRVRIADVRAICTAPEGIPLVVVKVRTSEDGLHGLGCATFTQRPGVVAAAVEHLAPLVVGRDVTHVEDVYQSARVSSYWRNGPVLNYALAGLEMALWDIKAKQAGVPLHELLGGQCRSAVPVYLHAAGRDAEEVEQDVLRLKGLGFRYVRCQVGVAGASTYGAASRASAPRSPGPPPPAKLWDPSAYCRAVPALFEHLRHAVGDELELLHDIHSRLAPPQAIWLAKALEPYRLFFLEDPLAPEDLDHFRLLREQTATPLAMGELLVQPSEYVPLVRDRLIDFLRVRVTGVGGIGMARKVAALCEFFGVRTAWQCPGDVSPVGHAASLALDLACHNFGIQETHLFGETAREVFPGCPEVRDGHLWPSDRPGLGVDLDERAAARYPIGEPLANEAWTQTRLADGTIIRP